MNILVPDITIAEKIVRSAVVYGFLLVAFRICGKRQLGQLTAFDLVVLLIIGNVVQNAVIGNDNSLGGGLIGATPILVLNAVLAYLTCGGSAWVRATRARPCVATGPSRCGTSATRSSRRTAT